MEPRPICLRHPVKAKDAAKVQDVLNLPRVEGESPEGHGSRWELRRIALVREIGRNLQRIDLQDADFLVGYYLVGYPAAVVDKPVIQRQPAGSRDGDTEPGIIQ